MFVKANAKINLYLDVISKRDDGYHDLDMVMLPIELHDSIFFDNVPYLKDSYITCDHVELQETKYNLINLTLAAMKKKYGIKSNFSISIHKEIPISAGLGGGSSNAAATIKAIRSMCHISMSEDEEIELAKSLGADVPFCLKNKPAHVEGIGEKISAIRPHHQFYVLILKPEKGLSTKRVFEESDKQVLEHGNVNDVIKALESGDDELLAKSMFNALEKTSIGLVPEIQDLKDMLKKDGFKLVLMSGSGSSVFALTRDKKFALNQYKKYDKKGYQVYLTKTL